MPAPRPLTVAVVLLGAWWAAPLAAETLYVSDESRDLVHVIDAENGSVVSTIRPGRRPRGLGVSADGRTLYVATSEDDRVAVVDARTGRVTGTLPSGPDPERFALDRTGQRLYVANEDDSLVSIVDVPARRTLAEVPVGAEPEGIAISPDGRTAVATSESAATVHFIDADTGAARGTVLVDSRPRFALFEPDGRRVWVSSETRGTLSVIDVRTLEVVGVVDFEAAEPPGGIVQPVGLAITQDSRRLFVALGRGNRIAEVDPQTLRIVRYFPSGSRTWHVALAHDERRLYAANGLSGDVTVVDLVANRVERTISLGGKPWDVAVRAAPPAPGPARGEDDTALPADRSPAGSSGPAVAAAVGAAAAVTAGAPAASRRTLRVCADPNNLPFSNERREGFENRIVELLAAEMQLDVQYVWWAQRRGYVRNTLGSGRCDVIPGVASGLEMLRTTRPYYRSTYVFVSRADRREALVDTFDDSRLRQLRIGVQLVGDDGANTPPAHALARRGIVDNVRGFPLYGDYATPTPPARILDAVAGGDVDVAVVWGPLAGWYATRSAVPLVLRPVQPWLDAARFAMVFDISMGVRKDDVALRRQLDEALQRNRAAVDRILAEYGVPRPEGAGAPAVGGAAH